MNTGFLDFLDHLIQSGAKPEIADRLTLSELLTTGNPKKLGTAFSWKDTPEGHNYWREIYTGDEPLSEEILSMLRERYSYYRFSKEAFPKEDYE